MKRRLIVSVFLLLFLASLFALDPDEMNQLTFANRLSGERSITHIFLRPAGGITWCPDILGWMSARKSAPEVIRSGGEKSFYAWHPGSQGLFDALVVDNTNQVYRVGDVAVQDGREAMVYVKDGLRDPALFGALAFTTLTVRNGTGREIFYLYFTVPGSQLWGAECLNIETTFPAGDRLVFTVVSVSGETSLDLLGLDEQKIHYKRSFVVPRVNEEILLTGMDRLRQ